MTIEEAIAHAKEQTEIFAGKHRVFLYLAIDALEKQKPKNWMAEYIGEGDFIWKCGVCNEEFILIDGTPQDNKYNYCPHCGQALDWSEEE